MSNRIYLISTNYLKENTTISIDVDDRLLLNAIYEAQELNLQQAMGTRLYKKILELVENHTIGQQGNENYKTLLDDYCMSLLVYCAWANVLPYVNYKIMNKGVENQSSENSYHTSIQEMNYIKEEITNKAEFFTQRLIDYLLKNKSLYPEYTSLTESDELSPNSNAYFSGIVFDGDTCPCIKSMGYNYRTISL